MVKDIIDKKITLDKFVKDFKKLNDSDYLLADKYVSFQEKCTICNEIIDKTSYVTVKNNDLPQKVFNINSRAREVIFIVMMFKLYTKIDIDLGKPLAVYDKLNEHGLVDVFMYGDDMLFPKKEIDEFKKILDMTLDDLLENERSMVGYIDNKLNALTGLLGSLVNKIENDFLQEDDEIENEITED